MDHYICLFHGCIGKVIQEHTNLNALLVHFQERRTDRVILVAFEKLLREPVDEARVVVALQLRAIRADALHLYSRSPRGSEPCNPTRARTDRGLVLRQSATRGFFDVDQNHFTRRFETDDKDLWAMSCICE